MRNQAIIVLAHFNILSLMFRSEAHMDWASWAVVIDAIKCRMSCNPFGDFQHVFILYTKISGSAQPHANCSTKPVPLVRNMLI